MLPFWTVEEAVPVAGMTLAEANAAAAAEGGAAAAASGAGGGVERHGEHAAAARTEEGRPGRAGEAECSGGLGDGEEPSLVAGRTSSFGAGGAKARASACAVTEDGEEVEEWDYLNRWGACGSASNLPVGCERSYRCTG